MVACQTCCTVSAGVLVAVHPHQRSLGEGAPGFSFTCMSKTQHRVFNEILRMISIYLHVGYRSVEFGHICTSPLGKFLLTSKYSYGFYMGAHAPCSFRRTNPSILLFSIGQPPTGIYASLSPILVLDFNINATCVINVSWLHMHYNLT